MPLTRGDVAWVELHSDGGGWAFGSSGGQTGLIAAWCVSPAASPSRVAGGDRAPPPIAAHARGEDEVEFVFAMGGGSKAEDGAHGPVRGTTPPHLRGATHNSAQLRTTALDARTQRIEARVREMQREQEALRARLDAQQERGAASTRARAEAEAAARARAISPAQAVEAMRQRQTWLYSVLSAAPRPASSPPQQLLREPAPALSPFFLNAKGAPLALERTASAYPPSPPALSAPPNSRGSGGARAIPVEPSRDVPRDPSEADMEQLLLFRAARRTARERAALPRATPPRAINERALLSFAGRTPRAPPRFTAPACAPELERAAPRAGLATSTAADAAPSDAVTRDERSTYLESEQLRTAHGNVRALQSRLHSVEHTLRNRVTSLQGELRVLRSALVLSASESPPRSARPEDGAWSAAGAPPPLPRARAPLSAPPPRPVTRGTSRGASDAAITRALADAVLPAASPDELLSYFSTSSSPTVRTAATEGSTEGDLTVAGAGAVNTADERTEGGGLEALPSPPPTPRARRVAKKKKKKGPPLPPPPDVGGDVGCDAGGDAGDGAGDGVDGGGDAETAPRRAKKVRRSSVQERTDEIEAAIAAAKEAEEEEAALTEASAAEPPAAAVADSPPPPRVKKKKKKKKGKPAPPPPPAEPRPERRPPATATLQGEAGASSSESTSMPTTAPEKRAHRKSAGNAGADAAASPAPDGAAEPRAIDRASVAASAAADATSGSAARRRRASVAAGMQAVRNPFGRRTSISSLSQAELASTASRDAGKTAGESRDEGDEGRNSAAAANTNHNHDGVEDGTTLPRASLPCAAGGPVILSLNEARRERNKNTIARRSSTKGVAPEATMRIRRRSSTQGVLPETMSITRRISTKGVTPAAAVGISRRSSTKGL